MLQSPNFGIHDDFPSGTATYYIQATESGVTYDRNLALQGYAISLVFLLPQKYFNSLFFAISRTSMVVLTGLLALMTNLILNYYFIFELDLGHYGLALATSVSSIIVFYVSIFWLFRQKILMV